MQYYYLTVVAACGDQSLDSATGTIQLSYKSLTEPCVWVIKGPSKEAYSTIYIMVDMLDIWEDDSLIIYNGPKEQNHTITSQSGAQSQYCCL